mmetsp:Transcript_71969/g.181911  ORF Transcript_71969/g.181911 Transcript_71969/m.181911 type:complete len:186 (-) Transcript_71969:426-983(-)
MPMSFGVAAALPAGAMPDGSWASAGSSGGGSEGIGGSRTRRSLLGPRFWSSGGDALRKVDTVPGHSSTRGTSNNEDLTAPFASEARTGVAIEINAAAAARASALPCGIPDLPVEGHALSMGWPAGCILRVGIGTSPSGGGGGPDATVKLGGGGGGCIEVSTGADEKPGMLCKSDIELTLLPTWLA